MELTIREDSLQSPQMLDLLAQHLRLMHEITPAQSVHALDVSGLQGPQVTAWGGWQGDTLVVCGALKQLDTSHGEIKSMHTLMARRGQGAAATMLRHILAVARQRGYQRVSLETGTQDAFTQARSLYEKHGFGYCGPFGEYTDDPNSAYMTLVLSNCA